MVSENYFIIVGKIIIFEKERSEFPLNWRCHLQVQTSSPPPKISEKNVNGCQSLNLEVENNNFQGQDVTVDLE